MKGLLIKDLRLLGGQKTFFGALIVIAAGMTLFTEDTTFAVGFLALVASMFSLSSISYDEMDNGNAFLFCLPISRALYAAEKYCFGLLLGSGAWLAATLFVLCVNVYKRAALPLDILLSSLMLLPLILLMQALVLPFDLKFGSERGRIAILGALGLLVLLGVLAVKGAEAAGIDLAAVLDSLPPLNMGLLIAAALLVSLVLWLLSMRISISIVKKKEF